MRHYYPDKREHSYLDRAIEFSLLLIGVACGRCVMEDYFDTKSYLTGSSVDSDSVLQATVVGGFAISGFMLMAFYKQHHQKHQVAQLKTTLYSLKAGKLALASGLTLSFTPEEDSEAASRITPLAESCIDKFTEVSDELDTNTLAKLAGVFRHNLTAVYQFNGENYESLVTQVAVELQQLLVGMKRLAEDAYQHVVLVRPGLFHRAGGPLRLVTKDGDSPAAKRGARNGGALTIVIPGDGDGRRYLPFTTPTLGRGAASGFEGSHAPKRRAIEMTGAPQSAAAIVEEDKRCTDGAVVASPGSRT